MERQVKLQSKQRDQTYTTMKTATYTDANPTQVNQAICSNFLALAKIKQAIVATSIK